MFASKDALIANAGDGYPINNSLRRDVVQK